MKTIHSMLVAALLTSNLEVCIHAAAGEPMPKEVATLLDDYLKEFSKVKEPNDKVLRAEALRIAIQLVSEGDAQGAKRIDEQVEAKITGRNITDVHPRLRSLLDGYDAALTSASKPIRAKYRIRADALLKGSSGRDMRAVVALGEVKQFIADDIPQSPASSGPESLKTEGAPSPASGSPSIVTNPAMGKKELSALVEGTKWEYRYGPDGSKIEVFSFEKNGRVRRSKPEGVIWESAWIPASDHITTENNLAEFRFDASGSFGEILFLSTKQRFRITTNNATISEKLPDPAQTPSGIGATAIKPPELRWIENQDWFTPAKSKWTFNKDGTGTKLRLGVTTFFSWKLMPTGLVQLTAQGKSGEPPHSEYIEFRSKSEASWGLTETDRPNLLHGE